MDLFQHDDLIQAPPFLLQQVTNHGENPVNADHRTDIIANGRIRLSNKRRVACFLWILPLIHAAVRNKRHHLSAGLPPSRLRHLRLPAITMLNAAIFNYQKTMAEIRGISSCCTKTKHVLIHLLIYYCLKLPKGRSQINRWVRP